MLIDDLAAELRQACAQAAKGDKVVTIHLFGISNARRLDGQSLRMLAEMAGIGPSYSTELRAGIQLAHYVKLK
jgi:hypothetical protein